MQPSMTISKSEITFRELFFYLFFAVMFGMRMWGIYESKPLYAPLLIVGFAFWIISMLMTELTVLEYLVCGALMLVAGLVYINTGEKGLLLYFALMLGMKGIETKKLFTVGIYAGMSGMICLTFLAAFGFIEDVAYVQPRAIVGPVFRHSLGFPHPNTLSSSFTILTMMIMYVIGHTDKKKLWKASAILLVCGLYLYLYSGSRTGIAITVGYLSLNLIYAYRNKLSLVEKMLVALIMPVLWIVSIVIPSVLTQKSLQGFVDKDPTLAARWTVGNYYLTYNTITPFGRILNNPKPEIDVIDMSQLYLYLQLGIVAFFVISSLWVALLHDEVRHERLSELVITVSLLLMGITDSFLYNIGFKNLAFAFMGVWLFGFLKSCETKQPELLCRGFQPLKIGSKSFVLPVLMIKGGNNTPKKAFIGGGILIATLTIIAIITYVRVPDPTFILADRGYGEKSFNWDGYGKTYSYEDIKEFGEGGNYVLNYTDDKEQMYVFYTNPDNIVANGWYAPMAGVIEKLRKSVSIVFFGVIFITILFRTIGEGHR